MFDVIPFSLHSSHILYLKNNQTAYAYGHAGVNQFGYYSSSRYNYLISFCEDPKTMISDIDDIYANSSCTYYTKPDGSFWAVGAIRLSTGGIYSKPVQIMIDEDTPLTDIVKADAMVALRDDGTVWIPSADNPAYFTQLMTEDGLPLTGVKTIHSSYANVAVTYDGSVYEFNIRFRSMNET